MSCWSWRCRSRDKAVQTPAPAPMGSRSLAAHPAGQSGSSPMRTPALPETGLRYAASLHTPAENLSAYLYNSFAEEGVAQHACSEEWAMHALMMCASTRPSSSIRVGMERPRSSPWPNWPSLPQPQLYTAPGSGKVKEALCLPPAGPCVPLFVAAQDVHASLPSTAHAGLVGAALHCVVTRIS